MPKTRPAVVTGIWSEIQEILCAEITEKLLRTTGHMNDFYLRDFFMFFNPIDLSNLLELHLRGIKGSIPTALFCIEKSRLALTTSTHIPGWYSFQYIYINVRCFKGNDLRLEISFRNLSPSSFTSGL